MKTVTRKLIPSRPPYAAPENHIISCHPEADFLGSNKPGGSIPTLDEGDVPDDLWG